MQSYIREKRKLNFNYKIIKPEIIQKIAGVIEGEINLGNSNGITNTFSLYSLDATDNSSYESKNALIFETGGIMYSKVIQKIEMRFQSGNYQKSIEVQFQHAQQEGTGNNYISVSGDDATWVNGTISRFSEILNYAQAQPQVQKIIGNMVLPVTVVVNILFFRIFYSYIQETNNDWLNLISFFGVPLGSLILFSNISDYLKRLWPSVELQTGPGYFHSVAKRRRKVIWIVSALIIPIFLAIIYDVFKSLLNIN